MELLTLNFESSKEHREAYIETILDILEEGQENPLIVHTHIKSAELIIKILTDNNDKTNKSFRIANQYSKHIMDAADKWNQNSFEFNGALFQKKEVSPKYNWKICHDPILEELEENLERAKAELKERQELLKKIPSEGARIVTIDGEVVKIFPPNKTTTSSLALTFK